MAPVRQLVNVDALLEWYNSPDTDADAYAKVALNASVSNWSELVSECNGPWLDISKGTKRHGLLPVLRLNNLIRFVKRSQEEGEQGDSHQDNVMDDDVIVGAGVGVYDMALVVAPDPNGKRPRTEDDPDSSSRAAMTGLSAPADVASYMGLVVEANAAKAQAEVGARAAAAQARAAQEELRAAAAQAAEASARAECEAAARRLIEAQAVQAIQDAKAEQERAIKEAQEAKAAAAAAVAELARMKQAAAAQQAPVSGASACAGASQGKAGSSSNLPDLEAFAANMANMRLGSDALSMINHAKLQHAAQEAAVLVSLGRIMAAKPAEAPAQATELLTWNEQCDAIAASLNTRFYKHYM
jgi:pyruvate/2-oxoglutarate dehydrogenase complex dihydrolipoamide acyltransferase (E2) component